MKAVLSTLLKIAAVVTVVTLVVEFPIHAIAFVVVGWAVVKILN